MKRYIAALLIIFSTTSFVGVAEADQGILGQAAESYGEACGYIELSFRLELEDEKERKKASAICLDSYKELKARMRTLKVDQIIAKEEANESGETL